MTDTLLEVEDLRVEFRTDEGTVQAVNGVSFSLRPGETLGLVGESGSGKSVTSLAIMGLVAPPAGRITSGRIFYRLQDLLLLPSPEMQRIRGRRIAMIFQDPLTALNPFLTVGEQLTEMTRIHLRFNADQARKQALEMLERVGIAAPERRIDQYPHEFSGGMRQRVMIAMALSCQPDVLIADEPTTALDVTIQAQMLELFQQLQRELGMAILLITHDLGVVAQVCHRVAVMYGGRIVETAGVDALFARPQHPYTLGLLDSLPRWDGHASHMLKAIEGQPPNMADPPTGCTFHPRCPFVIERCRRDVPPLESRQPVDATSLADGQKACFVDVRQTRAATAEVPHG